eukprot:scaffold232599_cov21-Tisochrysis_lutea.AAC.1
MLADVKVGGLGGDWLQASGVVAGIWQHTHSMLVGAAMHMLADWKLEKRQGPLLYDMGMDIGS